MGASGAGKTTLLNYLAERSVSRNLDISGTVEVNGKDRSLIRAGMPMLAAYIQQDDVLS
jgi:ABC-type multidrug transport system ATPase subunit